MVEKKKTPLERIKRKALWPRFVGFVIVCIIFAVLYNGMIAFFIHSIIEQKNRESYGTALSVRSYLNTDANLKDVDVLQEEFRNLDTINPLIQSICLIDSNNEVIWQTNEEKPDFSKKVYRTVYKPEVQRTVWCFHKGRRRVLICKY